MDQVIQAHFQNLESKDKETQYEAFNNLLIVMENKVDWAYEVWDQLIEELTDRNHHKRSRAAQFLSHLAISDPEGRLLSDFPKLWEVTKDVKFVTARHSLQAIWRVGLAGRAQQELVMNHLIERFHTSKGEKNATLIRFDIIQALRHLFDKRKEEEIKRYALELIATEEDSKYQKKYAAVWRNT